MTSTSVSNILDCYYQQLKEIDDLDRRVTAKIAETTWERVRIICQLRIEGEATEGSQPIPVLATIDKLLEDLKCVTQQIKDNSSSMRERINVLSRPSLRPLRILDMPDEILIKIFGYVKGWHPNIRYFYQFAVGVSEVKNLRLTCRRFCSTSSHLLVHFLRVEMDSSSLSCLEEISCHPTIAKGVAAVRVILSFYDSVMADDIWAFADYSMEKLRETTEFFERIVSVDYETKVLHAPEETVLETIDKFKAVLESWEAFIDGTPDDPANVEDLSYRMVIRKAHEEYRRRFAEQQRMREDGTFLQTVAAVMARMPRATRLEVRDNESACYGKRPYFFEQAKDNEALGRGLVFSIGWEEARVYNLGQPPAEILVKLPLAVHKAGVLLTGLSIELSIPEDFEAFAPSEQEAQNLTAAMQRLKTFEFCPRGTKGPSFWPAREPEEIQHLSRYLTAILDTETIDRIHLDFSSIWDQDTQPTFSLGPIISLRSWPKLFAFASIAVPFHLAELERFIDHISPATMILDMNQMHMLRGNWADGLDLLRKGAVKYCNLKHPAGGECEVLSEEKYKAIFANPTRQGFYDETSKAEDYIRGYIDQNPLRDESGELQHAAEEGSKVGMEET